MSTAMGDRGKHSNDTSLSTAKRRRVDSHDKKSKIDTSSKRGYYLMKSEADVFSIDDLASRDKQIEPWDGVRNHQAKKIMQGMQEGDLAFFWASNTKKPGIVGVVEVVKTAYPDETQFDPKSPYYYAKATRDAPVWYNVDVQLKEKFETPIYLSDLKQYATKELADMPLFTMKRLSVQHVPEPMWHFILEQKES
jgi:predicted RNA-binding protein with PUA-like domain